MRILRKKRERERKVARSVFFSHSNRIESFSFLDPEFSMRIANERDDK